MRGVGVRGSLPVAGVATVAILLSLGAPLARAQQATAALEDASTAVPASQDDYYTRRAKGILKAEKAAWLEPHPLAASYPGMDIVVCEAGCPDGSNAQVVSARRHVEMTETTEGRMVPTSADDSAAAAPQTTSVACVAGCYGMGANSDPDLLPLKRRPARTERMALPPRDKLSPVR